MNDRFKFRVWNGKNMFTAVNLFHEKDGSIDYVQVGFLENRYWGKVNLSFEKVVLMQSTDLRDKNGKLIFEGDIIQLDDIVVSVTWFDGSFHIITSPNQGRSPLMQERAKSFEVIGNIYEDPELLDKKVEK